MSELKTAKEILSDITGYTVEELTERNTEPLLQAEDCLTAMYCFLAQQQANGDNTGNSGLYLQRVSNSVCSCGNKLTEKEIFYETCLVCMATVEQTDC